MKKISWIVIILGLLLVGFLVWNPQIEKTNLKKQSENTEKLETALDPEMLIQETDELEKSEDEIDKMIDELEELKI